MRERERGQEINIDSMQSLNEAEIRIRAHGIPDRSVDASDRPTAC